MCSVKLIACGKVGHANCKVGHYATTDRFQKAVTCCGLAPMMSSIVHVHAKIDLACQEGCNDAIFYHHICATLLPIQLNLHISFSPMHPGSLSPVPPTYSAPIQPVTKCKYTSRDTWTQSLASMARQRDCSMASSTSDCLAGPKAEVYAKTVDIHTRQPFFPVSFDTPMALWPNKVQDLLTICSWLLGSQERCRPRVRWKRQTTYFCILPWPIL